MKKIGSVLLVLLLVCTLAAATAEDLEIHRDDAQFYFVVSVPEGAQVTDHRTDEQFSITQIEFLAPGKPTIIITTAADELYIGQNLSDLSDADVERIIAEITVEMAAPQTEIRTTPEGYQYIVVNESTPDNDTCDAVMLVNGYFVMVNVFYADFSELTLEDEKIGPSIVDTFRFVDNVNS